MPRLVCASRSAAASALEVFAPPERSSRLPAILHQERPRDAEIVCRGRFSAEPASAVAEEANSEFEAGEGELGGLLSAIADEVQRLTAAARAAVVLEYGGRIMHARRSLPWNQAAGAVQVIKSARAAALAHIAWDASRELASRRQAAIMRFGPSAASGRRRRRPKPPEGFERK